MEITGAYVVRGEIEDINAVEDFIRENTDMTIIYQCSSGGKLYITQEEQIIDDSEV
jgi:predicted peroxiredoxin